jgi:hypothetical protein
LLNFCVTAKIALIYIKNEIGGEKMSFWDNWEKKNIFFIWPTSEGRANFKGWWKNHWRVIANWYLLLSLIIVLSLLISSVIVKNRKIDSLEKNIETSSLYIDVLQVGNKSLRIQRDNLKAKLEAREVPVEVVEEVIKEVPVEVVREVDSFVPPALQDPIMYLSATATASEVRLVFPNVAKGSIEKLTYGIPSQADLISFFSYVEESKLFFGIKQNEPLRENEVDLLNLVRGLTEIWSSEAANGILDPSAGTERDSFNLFLFYDEQGSIGVMGYDLSGAKGSGNYWVITSYPEAKFFLGLY